MYISMSDCVYDLKEKKRSPSSQAIANAKHMHGTDSFQRV